MNKHMWRLLFKIIKSAFIKHDNNFITSYIHGFDD